MISLTVFLSLFLVMVVFFGFQLWHSWQIKRVKVEISKIETKLSGLQEVTQSQLYLRSRLNLIRGFLGSRVKSRESIERVFSLDLPGVVVANAFFVDEQVLNVRLETDSVEALSRSFQWLKDDDFFLQAVNRGVSRLSSGGYTMQVELTIPKEKEVK